MSGLSGHSPEILTKERQVLRFLGFSARIDVDQAFLQAFTDAVAALSDQAASWDFIIEEAERQGMAPLLYHHLRTARIELPDSPRRILKGLYLRHRLSGEAKTGVLREILPEAEERGIDLRVLKGNALAHLVYPEPGLRPSSDIDLLVPDSHLPASVDLLESLGFWMPKISFTPAYLEKHLPQATLLVDGENVKVDIHHRLLKRGRPNRLDLPGPDSSSLSFTLGEGGPTARTLGYEDTLRYLCLHFCEMGHEPLSEQGGNTRLIWAADITGFAARYSGEINWERLKRESPFVPATLGLLGFLSPLPARLRALLPAAAGEEPEGVGRGYGGWPGISFSGRGEVGAGRLLRETFFPSEWWLRLYYGLGTERRLFRHRWLRHPAHVVGQVGRLVRRRLIPSPSGTFGQAFASLPPPGSRRDKPEPGIANDG